MHTSSHLIAKGPTRMSRCNLECGDGVLGYGSEFDSILSFAFEYFQCVQAMDEYNVNPFAPNT